MKLNFSKIEFCVELDFTKIMFHVLCAIVEVAGVAFPIKNSHIELDFCKIKFYTIFKKKIELDICSIEFFEKTIDIIFLKYSSIYVVSSSLKTIF